ncbi:4-hydroxy-3-methylbut-2-enyl diphosphate synthase [Perilla frutescens var. frutescens]|nr:4-hydroxy-3-methylbut-2-enyl diphosphate synthase [Perilla frutescens var. frutescens]
MATGAVPASFTGLKRTKVPVIRNSKNPASETVELELASDGTPLLGKLLYVKVMRIAGLGADIVRITVYNIPLVADIHFAMQVGECFDKIRVKPGNFADRRAQFEKLEYIDEDYQKELEHIEKIDFVVSLNLETVDSILLRKLPPVDDKDARRQAESMLQGVIFKQSPQKYVFQSATRLQKEKYEDSK